MNSRSRLVAQMFDIFFYIWEMFCEVELVRDVKVVAEKADRDGLNFQRYIMARLLENLLKERASKDHGYFIAVTSLKSIGKGQCKNKSQYVTFPITFGCRTFVPSGGEILLGVVRHVFRRGLLLKCGPINYVFLSSRKMPTYHYVGGKNPVFSSNEFATIRTESAVRFNVLGVRWIEKRGCIKKEFVMLASLEGSNTLGPISLSEADELGLQT
ncbi:DNA-directed RNA polymerase V subunit 7-like isoform X1 [Cucurbita pepo subsp. pepo]|uniref:DNA-directed RNA polymerase V subunit 7-like isoform X1 n=1 Tax=Cucurbita pepo subsp. pepo TaxID=3664 RepID=UPI000C9D834C|nr:DNA-directed RNA polymerase V subunit 7-like isoform X1 [Cucurbita pepo subsp. pepo]XP_023538724.1 DNA-directed RNA polymerase V subunit 7-like isoform X1 [Cucurbita pepo subsp. pepo]